MLKVGELAKRTGLTVRTLHHYDEIGLLTPSGRSSSGSTGKVPEVNDWLATLDLMSTYRKYFTSAELQKIFRNWKKTQAEWTPLIAAVRSAFERTLPADSVETQQLAHRWMEFAHAYRTEPLLQKGHMIEPDMRDFIASFEPIVFQQRLADIGFTSTNNFGPAEVNARYFVRRKDGLQVGDGGFRYMCARV